MTALCSRPLFLVHVPSRIELCPILSLSPNLQVTRLSAILQLLAGYIDFQPINLLLLHQPLASCVDVYSSFSPYRSSNSVLHKAGNGGG